MENNRIFEMSASLGLISKTKVKVDNYPIKIRIINKSSVDFIKAEVAVKAVRSDKQTIAYFGPIAANSTGEETVYLPAGVESCTFQITPKAGLDITGEGEAGDALGIDLTITD